MKTLIAIITLSAGLGLNAASYSVPAIEVPEGYTWYYFDDSFEWHEENQAVVGDGAISWSGSGSVVGAASWSDVEAYNGAGPPYSSAVIQASVSGDNWNVEAYDAAGTHYGWTDGSGWSEGIPTEGTGAFSSLGAEGLGGSWSAVPGGGGGGDPVDQDFLNCVLAIELIVSGCIVIAVAIFMHFQGRKIALGLIEAK
jgi:hypothetical protein